MEKYGPMTGECEVRIELAITLHMAGEDAEAVEHIDRALATADRLSLQPQRAKALHTLAIIKDDKDLRAQADTLYEQLGLPKPLPPPTLRE